MEEFQNIIDAIKYLRSFEKRGFEQSVDLNITLKNIDLKRPENKFSKEVLLPHGRGKDINVCIISESRGIGKKEIEEMERDKKKAKEFSKKYDFFICEAPLMAIVGKSLGKYLAPKGKMPKLLPPGKDPNSMIEEAKRSVRIRVRDSPSIQVIVGRESMTDEQIKENIDHIIEEIKKTLPSKVQIKSAYIKFTMTKPAKIKV